MHRIHIKQTNEYNGFVDDVPAWARKIVAPWYRRVLAAPLTIYVTIVAGISVGAHTELSLWWDLLLFTPTFVLAYHVSNVASKKWYRDRFVEMEAAQNK